MRVLLWISILLVGLWSAYWFIGRSTVERTANAFFDSAAARGLVATHQGLSISGFPNRFDLTLTGARLADQRSGFAWDGAFLQIFSLSYKPWHVIAAFPPLQHVVTPTEDMAIESAKLQASVVVSPNAALTLDRTTLVGSALSAASSRGWRLRADALRFATRLDPTRTDAHQIGLEISGLIPDPAWTRMLPSLPAAIETLRLDAVTGFSAPIDRHARETRPELLSLNLREGSLAWGDLNLFARGNLAFADGIPDGRIDIRVEGWRSLLPLIEATGAVKPEVVPTVERMLEVLAAQTGGEALELPLTFAGGQMRLGPLPLGPAPRL